MGLKWDIRDIKVDTHTHTLDKLWVCQAGWCVTVNTHTHTDPLLNANTRLIQLDKSCMTALLACSALSSASFSWSDHKEGGLPPAVGHGQGWGNRDDRGRNYRLLLQLISHCLADTVVTLFLNLNRACHQFGTNPSKVSTKLHFQCSDTQTEAFLRNRCCLLHSLCKKKCGPDGILKTEYPHVPPETIWISKHLCEDLHQSQVPIFYI